MTDDFISSFPTTPNDELSLRYGVTRITIQRWAKKLELKKDPSYKSDVQRSNATGHVLSDESRVKIALKARGRQISEETRERMRTSQQSRIDNKGELHYKWKGGKAWTRFRDPEYISWRNAVLQRDNYTCQDCGRECKKNERGLAAHHLREYNKFPEFRFDISNGLTLCKVCHMGRHGKRYNKANPIPCACGCGTLISPFDVYHKRPRRFVNGHGRRSRELGSPGRIRTDV